MNPRPLLMALPMLICLVPAGYVTASTTLGEVFTPDVTNGCNGFPDWEMFQTGRADGTSYAVATSGVLTAWRFTSGTAPTTLTMRVFRPTSAPDSYLVVADGGPMLGFPASSGTHTVPTRVPVQAGDIVGVRSIGGGCSSSTASAADTWKYHLGTATTVGGTSVFTANTNYKIDIAAVLEPDADHDGYGDETQDFCPASALSQATCPPPETKIKGKVDPSAAKTRLKLTSTVPGSTFTCALDKKKTKPCQAKVTYTCLSSGKHRLRVTATSPAGIADPSPAKRRFRLDAHRAGC